MLRDPRCPETAALKLTGHRQEVCGLKWNPDETLLASGGNDNKVSDFLCEACALCPYVVRPCKSFLAKSLAFVLFCGLFKGSGLKWNLVETLLTSGGNDNKVCDFFFCRFLFSAMLVVFCQGKCVWPEVEPGRDSGCLGQQGSSRTPLSFSQRTFQGFLRRSRFPRVLARSLFVRSLLASVCWLGGATNNRARIYLGVICGCVRASVLACAWNSGASTLVLRTGVEASRAERASAIPDVIV